eukprot:scaffold15963_cov94-Skeletonema_dohrnii-CCMP3373.AAC.1
MHGINSVTRTKQLLSTVERAKSEWVQIDCIASYVNRRVSLNLAFDHLLPLERMTWVPSVLEARPADCLQIHTSVKLTGDGS